MPCAARVVPRSRHLPKPSTHCLNVCCRCAVHTHTPCLTVNSLASRMTPPYGFPRPWLLKAPSIFSRTLRRTCFPLCRPGNMVGADMKERTHGWLPDVRFCVFDSARSVQPSRFRAAGDLFLSRECMCRYCTISPTADGRQEGSVLHAQVFSSVGSLNGPPNISARCTSGCGTPPGVAVVVVVVVAAAAAGVFCCLHVKIISGLCPHNSPFLIREKNNYFAWSPMLFLAFDG
ncbi:unnamed protein product [Ectocarpus sp. 4 AP-2014]